GFKRGLRYTKDCVSVVSAYQHSKLIAPMVYKGTMDSVSFNTYMTKVLLPLLPQGSIVSLDNTPVHKSSHLPNVFQEYGCHLPYLPPYSPELNPIERLKKKKPL
ncbi:IS630 family transposase, partial [bacterium]|nr:IS630 family transposase [bacterium]